MIAGAAVCPGAPFLVPGVSAPLAGRRVDLAQACVRALADLPAADRTVVIAAGRSPAARLVPAGTPVGSAALMRSDRPGGPPGQHVPDPDVEAVRDPAVGSIVGAALVAAAGRSPADIVEVGADPAAAVAIVRERIGGARRAALIVVADGAATHGDDAPGRRDDRAAGFDDALADALRRGDPRALRAACADRSLSAALLAVTDPLVVLALMTVSDPPAAADLLYRGSPEGVGYLVAAWRWARP